MLPVILSTHALHPRAEALLAEVGTLRIASALDEATLQREGREAEILIVRAPVPAALFGQAPALRAAIRHGAGVDMIPLDAATAAGVLVANVPGVNARSVAEYVLMAALMLSRRMMPIDRDLRTEGWLAGRDHAVRARELCGQTMGLVGFGAVGRAVADLAGRGLGMRLLATSRRGGPYGEGVETASLDQILAESDFVTLCVPLTEETRGLIGRERLARMRPGAMLINVARGAVVDEAALLDALQTGRLAGAALDVFASQPLTRDHPLLTLPGVVLTPHLAGITEESMERMGVGAAEEARRILAGDLPVNLVNPDAVSLYRGRFGGRVR
jgi:D-3-phosphoglycerate dehydrogenase / 2-oxoglutarate reductase